MADQERLHNWGIVLLAAGSVLLLAVFGRVLLPGAANLHENISWERWSERDSKDLATRFAETGYHWPPEVPLPPISVQALPEDMDALPVAEKKAVFFRILAPLVAAENARIRADRRRLTELLAARRAGPANSKVERELLVMSERYGMDGRNFTPDMEDELLLRVDIIPPGLALAQAANESGWGTSRFAREANNLFGMWTWDPDKGLEPSERSEDASHYVRIFENLRASVANYMYTLNTGSAYRGFRELRASQRAQGKQPDPLTLAPELDSYSQRGEAYVEELAAMLRQNDLDELKRLQLEAQSGGK
ncbi:MAG: glucosaminidase domain-containing protein [Gammaproteobacteria bacterium]|nr:glucosaminidase domain-containing protein [Gammaproteobacteria bacterium]